MEQSAEFFLFFLFGMGVGLSIYFIDSIVYRPKRTVRKLVNDLVRALHEAEEKKNSESE
jgi:hypothetical protein